MHSLGIIDEKDKSGRVDLHLCGVIDFEVLMTYHTGIVTADGCSYHFIKTRGGHPQIAHVGYFECRLKDRFDMIAGFCRCEDNRGIGNEFEPFSNDPGIGFCTFNLLIWTWKCTSALGTTL